MYSLSLISLLFLSNPFLIHSGVKNAQDNYLPLILIHHKGNLYYPNQIKKATIDEHFGFIGDAQFSKDDWTNQMIFCPADSIKQLDKIDFANKLLQSSTRLRRYYSETEIGRDCLFTQKIPKDKTLQCAKEPIPVIYQIKVGKLGEQEEKLCGPYNRSKLYKFVYDVCPPIKLLHRILLYFPLLSVPDMAKFIRKVPFVYVQQPVYEICYNHENDKTVYTQHVLESVNLLFDEQLEHEKKKQHSMMTDGYQNFGKVFEEKEKFYKSFETSIKKDEPFNDQTSNTLHNPDIYLAQKLVPPDDLATAVLKKTTFHYINVQPMHQNLVDLWNYIEELIRKNFKNQELKMPLQIYTGAFTSTDHPPRDWPKGVPHMWIKLLYQKEYNSSYSPTLAIMMKNEYNHREYDFVLSGLCEVDYCEYFKQREDMLERFSKLALEKLRCCIFNDKIDDFFNLHLLYKLGKRLLPIANLTDEGEKVKDVVYELK